MLNSSLGEMRRIIANGADLRRGGGKKKSRKGGGGLTVGLAGGAGATGGSIVYGERVRETRARE